MAAPINIPSATAVKTITANGGNLFRISLDNLNDALQWNRIASANHIIDPFLPINDVTTLIIPQVNKAASDTGILQPNVGTPVFASGPGSLAQIPPIDDLSSETPLIPVNITPPEILGMLSIGQTLTATSGTWENGPTAFAFQWYRGNTLIAVVSSYILIMGDEGETFTVSVVAVNSAGPSLPATSTATISVGSHITYDLSDPSQSGIQFWLKVA